MLPVYYQDRVVGQLAKEDVGVSFQYEADWIKASDKFAISLTMPLRDEPYANDVATPWFANLLPEERQLATISRLLGRGQGDVYGLLKEIGRDTAGALSIGGPEPANDADYHEFTETELAKAIERLPERPLLAGEPDVTMSLAGAQSKLPVAVFDGKITLPLRGAVSTHILKPESPRLYATVTNELLCMRLAKSIGIQAAETTVGIADGRSYLLVERYDRFNLESGGIQRGHQEDFCQALGFYPIEKYQASGGPSLVDMYNVFGRFSGTPARDRLALLDLVIYACCIGDTDRHGKNYSMMLTHGKLRLAEAYDLMSALLYDGVTRNLAMRIADRSRGEHIERRHWERFALEVGLSPAATVRRVKELSGKVADEAANVADALPAQLPVERDALKAFADRIHERAGIVAANSQRGPATDDHLRKQQR